MKKLNEIFSDWMTGGIFTALNALNVPWKNENISTELDLEYHGNRSGEKYISPLLQKLTNGEEITEAKKTQIATVIFTLFSKQWTKLYNTLFLEYNPIQNYDMIEQMIDDETITEYGKTNTHTGTITTEHTGTDTETPNITESDTGQETTEKTGTEATAHTGTERTDTDNSHSKEGTETTAKSELATPNLLTETNGSIFGFNSSTSTPTDEATTETTGNTSTTGTQTITYDIGDSDDNSETTTHNTTDTTTYNTEDETNKTNTHITTGSTETAYDTQTEQTTALTDEEGGSDTHTRNYRLTRKGNIGVTTSQQMIEAERELWKYNFFEQVFTNIDKILTIDIY